MVESPQSLRRRTRISAFSLIEVTIALGVMSFCLLTTIGLLPVAVNTMRSAMDSTISSQIMQQISSQATLTPFSELTAYVNGSQIQFFDQEGQPAQRVQDRRYKVSLEKMDPEKVPPFPGAQQAASLPNSLFVIKSVVSDARMAKDPAPLTYVLYVPNSGG